MIDSFWNRAKFPKFEHHKSIEGINEKRMQLFSPPKIRCDITILIRKILMITNLCENKNKSISRQLNGIHPHKIDYLIIIAIAIDSILPMLNSYQKKKIIKKSIQIPIIGEYGNYPEFPKARALQYNKERGQAYLLCSGWVQELPCRYGRHTLL